MTKAEHKHNPGAIMKARSADLRQRILAFFREHPFATQAEAAAELGVNHVTISRHVKALRASMREDMKV